MNDDAQDRDTLKRPRRRAAACYAVASHDRGKVRVPAGELRYAFGERLGCELERHLNLTSRDPAM